MGRASYDYGIIMDLKNDLGQPGVWGGGDWTYEIIPRKGKIGPGGNAFNLSTHTQNRSTELAMEAYVNGYAYAPSGATTKLEMAVLAAYTIVVMAHAAYSIYSGLSSSSWGSAPEIAALAWNSPPAEEMKNTGAGITTVSVFKNNIRVMQRSDKLEILVQESIGRVENPEPTVYGAEAEDAQESVARVETQDLEPVEENRKYS